MRKAFSNIVEKGRDNSLVFGTKPGSPFGAFFIRCQFTGELLRIIVGDGQSAVEAGLQAWDHVSVSCERRCPTWAEMCFVKSLFFEDSECVIQYHPPQADYINQHDFVLHLWRPAWDGAEIPMPPKECV